MQLSFATFNYELTLFPCKYKLWGFLCEEGLCLYVVVDVTIRSSLKYPIFSDLSLGFLNLNVVLSYEIKSLIKIGHIKSDCVRA